MRICPRVVKIGSARPDFKWAWTICLWVSKILNPPRAHPTNVYLWPNPTYLVTLVLIWFLYKAYAKFCQNWMNENRYKRMWYTEVEHKIVMGDPHRDKVLGYHWKTDAVRLQTNTLHCVVYDVFLWSLDRSILELQIGVYKFW